MFQTIVHGKPYTHEEPRNKTIASLFHCSIVGNNPVEQCGSFMNKITNIKQAISISKHLRNEDKTIVLVGGCFDIIHKGHIIFLEHAKKQGDILFVLLESDMTIRKLKGSGRPVNNQQDRATVVSALKYVDYVICLPSLYTNDKYDRLIQKIKPHIIATTKNDPQRYHKERQAKQVQAKIIDVTDHIPNHSTSKIASIIFQDL